MKNVNQSLLSLGEAKLGIQAATSIGYDTQALGLMAVAVALIGVSVALARGLGPIWWLPLGGLGGSLLISVAAISQPEIDTGQDMSLALRVDLNGEQTDRLVLTSIAQAINDNTRSLQDKRGLVALSTLFIGLSFALVGVAQLLPSFWETIESLAR